MELQLLSVFASGMDKVEEGVWNHLASAGHAASQPLEGQTYLSFAELFGEISGHTSPTL